MNTYTRLNRGDAGSPVRLEVLRRATLLELAEAFHEEVRMISEAPSVAELPEVHLIREINREWKRSRSRIIADAVKVAVLVLLSLWVGYWFGTGTLDPRVRYNSSRIAAQRGEVVEYGPAEVYRYRRAAAEWERLMRQLEAAEKERNRRH